MVDQRSTTFTSNERIYLVVCSDFPQLKNTNAPHFAHF